MHTIPQVLLRGAVRPAHVLFLYFVFYIVSIIAGGHLAARLDPTLRQSLQLLIGETISACFMLVVTLVVPEMRRSLKALYGAPSTTLRLPDAFLILALLLTWALGANMVLVDWVLLTWDPHLFGFLGFHERTYPFNPWGALAWIAAAGVLAPLAEELVFRGYLQNLWSSDLGRITGVALSALLFAAFHLQMAAFAFVFGLILSLVYLKYGSLWPGTVLHGIYNVIVIPIGPVQYLFTKRKSEIWDVQVWLVEVAFLIMFIPLVAVFWRRFRPAT
jgi:membrane protease YdiL (CAAX protease family)